MIRYTDYVGDFETVVFDEQESTEVWASVLITLHSGIVKLFHSLPETLQCLCDMKHNCRVYYHNLKFDGAFWLDYLLRNENYCQAYIETHNNEQLYKWIEDKDMPCGSFKYTINKMGQWYSILIRTLDGYYIKLQDSLKLLPFSVNQIAKGFNTKVQKLDMEYKGKRYAGCEIKPEEKEYITNDALIVKEALEFMRKEGHHRNTIGGCCLEEFRTIHGQKEYKMHFPDLTEISCPIDDFNTADDYVRKSYHGGWCYVVKGKEDKVFYEGNTYDVNSLYPSMMSSESGNVYPIGKPKWGYGEDVADQFRYISNNSDYYYFVRIKTRFYIKENKLPFIQIKHNLFYESTEMLETSDVFSKRHNRYCRELSTFDGEVHDTRVIMTLTMTDYILFREHYNVEDFEILDFCYFFTNESGGIGPIFDKYINKYKDIKLTTQDPAQRQLAKLFLNNLYGKMASNNDNSFKIADIIDDRVKFMEVESHEKEVGYIPVGSAITSYARNFTIRAAQANYYGPDNAGFIYADTDSIHCDIPEEDMKGIKLDSKQFNCWKHETHWNKGIFHRQKTYIEHITEENNKPVKAYYNIKCAGMPQRCKDLFNDGLKGTRRSGYVYCEEEKQFLSKKYKLTDFRKGFKVYGKLLPKRIHGGIVLEDSYFELLD